MIKLIPNWQKWWRMWSMRLGALGTLVTGYVVAVPDAALTAWNALPQELKNVMPPNWLPMVGVGIFVSSLFARLIHQPKLNEAQSNDRNSQP